MLIGTAKAVESIAYTNETCSHGSDWTTVSRRKEHHSLSSTKKQQQQQQMIIQGFNNSSSSIPSSTPRTALQLKVESGRTIPSPKLAEEELAEIRKLMKSCKIMLDEEMVEFLRGCKVNFRIHMFDHSFFRGNLFFFCLTASHCSNSSCA